MQELKFLGYLVGLYTIFIYWGFLQEKITSHDYRRDDDGTIFHWDCSFGLNFCMSLATYLTASIVDLFAQETRNIPLKVFWKPAMSSCLASPIGYLALKYISYPLMVLTKSSKPVPVMLVGILFYGKSYHWSKYASVAMVCGGIFLFMSSKKAKHSDSIDPSTTDASVDLYLTLFGMLLVLFNLALDGYTNNEQDYVFKNYSASAMDMMKNVNFWQTIYQAVFLYGGMLLFGATSELQRANSMLGSCAELRQDVAVFCFFASVGQVLIFGLMKDFGSLVWITVSVTRKLFTIIVSVFMFNHHVNSVQWMGVALVFAGLSLEIAHNYSNQNKAKSDVVAKQEIPAVGAMHHSSSALQIRGKRSSTTNAMSQRK